MKQRHALLVALAIVSFSLLLATPALAWQNGRATRSMGAQSTQQWILQEANEIALAAGVDWVDVQAAVTAVTTPDTRMHDFRFHTYDRWGPKRSGLAPLRVASSYEALLDALAAGDRSAASRHLGLLAHYYTDACNPLHTDDSRVERRRNAHRRYEQRVMRLLNRKAPNAANGSAADAEVVEIASGLKEFTESEASAAHNDYRKLVRGFRRHGFEGRVVAVTTRTLERAVQGVASVIVRADKDKHQPRPKPTLPSTPSPSPSATSGPTPTLSPTPAPTPTSSPSPAPTPGATLDVRSFGAAGSGAANDSVAVQRAVDQAAAIGGTVYFPAGTYLCPTPIRLSKGADLRGEGDGSWLKGQLVFASSNVVESLKIGDAGRSAITHSAGATGTTFRACRFHGGGSTEGVNGSVVHLGGSQGSVSDILFTGCEIERTSYVPPAGVDAFARNVGNTITIHEFTWRTDTAHVEGITFRDCHLGASNGRDKGALRMMMEAFCWDDRTGLAYHGWKDLTFDGCTIEAGDTAGLDFADDRLLTGSSPARHASSGVLITGCTFLGARKNDAYGHGGLPIIYECPTGMVIRDNTFYASPQEAIGGSKTFKDTTAPGLLIEGNTFDMTRSQDGLVHQKGQAIISLVGYNTRVVGNSFLYDAGWGVLVKGGGGTTVFDASDNRIEGNTFTDTRTSGGESTIKLADDYGLGCFNNRIVANTIRNRGAGRAGVIYQSSGTGINYASDNRIDCGSSLPFLVRSGAIVQSGNIIE